MTTNKRARRKKQTSVRSNSGCSRQLRLERLEDRRLLAWDFGDAPSPYPTLAGENGAKHADDWMQLGASIVGESASEKSGRSVSMSSDGTRLAVGSYENDGVFSDAGHVRIYERIDGNWSQLGSDIDGQRIGERFGFSVSLSGDGGTVVVGSSHNNGMVRVYRFVDGNWEQVGVDLNGESNQDMNGYAVSVNEDGSIIAIGAPNNHGGGDFSGQARVFQLLDSSWQQLGSDIHGLANSFSGISLALAASGSRLVVGAPFGGGGLVRTYDFNGSDWVQLGSDIVGETDGDVFGRSVSMNAEGNVIAVGADYNEGNGTQAGHVRVFELVEGAWIQIGADLDGEQSYHRFGFSVDLDSSGETLAVGAPHTSTAGEDNPGSMILYKRSGDSWVQLGKRLTGNLNGEAFGWSVSLDASGTNVVAGVPRAPNPSSGGTEWGTANVYAIGTASLRLGQKKSLELVGNVSQNAEGDGDSDDGVIFGELKVGQANASVLVNVQNANVNAKLDAWIDFNGDGIWSIGQEKIFDSVVLVNGDNHLQFSIPVDASTGSTFARFRLSSLGDLFVTGEGIDGEVEDYQIVIDSNSIPTLDPIGDISASEDSVETTIVFNGVTAGGGESQSLRVSALSSDASLIPNPEITYTSPEATGTLSFTPLPDAYGTATITVTVEDGGLDGILETAADNATVTRTFVVTVNAVNDPPILESAASPKLHSIDRISGPPIGAVGTPVASLIDTGGPLDNFSDVDGDLPGIAITATNLHGGTLWFSENGGAMWMKVEEATDQNPRLLAADAASRLYFEPESQFGGTIDDLITFRAWDRNSRRFQLGTDINGEAPGDQSGDSVSLSSDGNTVAIGAPYNNGNGDGSGHVRIYDWNGVSWQRRGVDIDGEAAYDQSGKVSLSSNGNTVAIGAPNNNGGTGHVRIFDWNGSAWQQRGTDIDGEADEYSAGEFPSLSSDGNTVAIGFPNSEEGPGHVRIFDWNGSAWQQRGLTIDGEALADWLGEGQSISLSSDGNTVAVGAVGNDGNGDRSGHVRIYDWNGSAWQQRGIDIDGEAAGDNSGFSVSLSSDGNTVSIGAVCNDGNGDCAGHVRIYDWNGVLWQQRGNDIDGESFVNFSGWSQSLSSDGNTVAIGAPYNNGNGDGSGHVRIYDWNGVSWQRRGVDIDGESAGDASGSSVSLSSDGITVAIGAPGGSGYVRIYRMNDQPTLSLESDIVSVLVNATPTLDVLPDMAFNKDAEVQLVNLRGISAGGGESQPLKVTATSSNATVASVSAVDYESAQSSGVLSIALAPNVAGVSVITVSVEDGGLDNDITTIHDNATVETSFEVAVGLSSFNQSGDRLVSFVRPASQTLTVSSSESSLALQLAEGVWYGDDTISASGSGESSLVVLDRTLSRFELIAKRGQAIKFDRPLGWRMAAWDPISEPDFRPVESVDDPTRLLYLDWGQPWQNILDPSDINNNGSITALDALQIINELSIQQYTDRETGMLLDPESLPIWPGTYYDQNGDGKATSLDALRVINSLTRIIRSGEGEAVTADYLSQDVASIWSHGMQVNDKPVESEFEETELIYSDADPETSKASDRPEDLVYATVGQKSTEAVDSLLSDLEDWWK